MQKTDHESRLWRTYLGEPRFHTGQSVLHWWSSWFAAAQEPRKQLQKNSRPSWYDATISSHAGMQTIKYAGVEYTQHCYRVY